MYDYMEIRKMNVTRTVEVDPEPRTADEFLGTPDECPRCLGHTENAGLCDSCDEEVDL